MTPRARISLAALLALVLPLLPAPHLRESSASPGVVIGPLGGLARTVKLIEPFGVAFDRSDNAYICEYKGQRISKLDKSGMLSLLRRHREDSVRR